MRSTRTTIALALMILALAACGSPAASDGGNGDGDGTDQTESAEPTQDDGNDGNGNGSGSLDVDRVFEILTPPNSTEITKTTAEGVIFAAFETDDDLASLESFYEDAFDEAGLQIISTTSAQGGFAWVVAEDEESSFGGSVSVFPASDGSGTQVSITIGDNE